MQAVVGDQLFIGTHRVGEAARKGEIVEVHGAGGAPPYLVRWSDGHTSTFVPSADTTVEHVARRRAARR